jgi:hypothetical protein
MKIYLDDNFNYIEIKENKRSELIDLSIRVNTDKKDSMIVTTSLNKDTVESLIAGLISLKIEMKNE